MRKIIFGLAFLTLAIGASAQTAKNNRVTIRAVGAGKIVIAKGSRRSTIDLSKDVAGCVYTPIKYKRELDAKGCASPPAAFKLINATAKNNQTFLIVETEAQGNCNVCGRCGASEATALVWLKLDARLRVLEKKAVPIEFCLFDVSLVGSGIKPDETTNGESPNLKFKDDVLTVEFEKMIFDDQSEISGYEFSHLEYNRKTPEKGFVIKTEKRAKSSVN